MGTFLYWLPLIVLILLVLVIEYACILDRRDAYTRARKSAFNEAALSMQSQAEIARRAANNPEYSEGEQRRQMERYKAFIRAGVIIGSIPPDRL